MKPKIGDNVLVSAVAFGDGIEHVGVIQYISHFHGSTYIYVKFHTPSSLGISGITLTNVSLIQKLSPCL